MVELKPCHTCYMAWGFGAPITAHSSVLREWFFTENPGTIPGLWWSERVSHLLLVQEYLLQPPFLYEPRQTPSWGNCPFMSDGLWSPGSMAQLHVAMSRRAPSQAYHPSATIQRSEEQTVFEEHFLEGVQTLSSSAESYLFITSVTELWLKTKQNTDQDKRHPMHLSLSPCGRMQSRTLLIISQWPQRTSSGHSCLLLVPRTFVLSNWWGNCEFYNYHVFPVWIGC